MGNGLFYLLFLVTVHHIYEVGTLMRPLTDLHDPKSIALSYPDLLQQCENFFDFYAFSFTQATNVEEMTRSQSNCRIWFQQRAGRITASRFRQILHTNCTQPSVQIDLLSCNASIYAKSLSIRV